MDSSGDTAEFRLHIHNLLHDYAVTHCTTNFLTFTEDAVFQFLCSLRPAPLTDPFSLVLATDPYDAFSRIHDLPALQPYGEIPQTTNEARLYLKKWMGSIPGKSKTETVVFEDDYGKTPPDESLFPVLTRAARLATPKLGKLQPSIFAQAHSELLLENQITYVQVEQVQEPQVSIEQVLQLGITKREEDVPALKSLLQHEILRGKPTHKNRFLDPAFLREVPPCSYVPVEEEFLPYFPRVSLQTLQLPAKSSLKPQSLKDLNISRSPIPTEETDLALQNLVNVDGWEAFKSSPPSSLEAESDMEDQLDELFMVSSPNTEPHFIEEIEKARLDVPLMPLSRSRGGNAGVSKHILANKSYDEFIRSTIHKAPDLDQAFPCSHSSLLGEPSVVSGYLPDHSRTDLDTEIEKLYAQADLDWTENIVDDKDDILMEVPTLPAPNIHPDTTMLMPTKLSQYLTPRAKNSKDSSPNLVHQFLKKAKGNQSLAIALSWVAFKVDEKLPTVTEIVGAESPFDVMFNEGCVDTALVDSLLDSVAFLNISVDETDGYSRSYEVTDDYVPPVVEDDLRILLSKKERLRLRGTPVVDDIGSSDFDGQAYEKGVAADDFETSPQKKRPRLGTRAKISDIEQAHLTRSDPGPFLHLIDGDDGGKENLSPLSHYQPGGIDDVTDDLQYTQFPIDSSESQVIQELAVVDDGYSDVPAGGSSLPRTQKDIQTCVNGDSGCHSHEAGFAEKLVDLGTAGDNLHRQSVPSLAIEPEMSRHALGVTAFAQLRAKKITENVVAPPTPILDLPIPGPPEAGPRKTPKELIDANTICLPETIDLPNSIHKYMASLSMIQKRVLVRALRSQECSVELVERETLNGVDLILDPFTGVIFIPLFILPSKCNSYVERISQQSWSFRQLLVVLEAYPESRSKKVRTFRGAVQPVPEPELCAYTVPIIKAIKKLRRDLDIAGACGTKSASTRVQYAFADTVDEAALITRYYGNFVESVDPTQGAVWGERVWLDLDFAEDDEANLALAGGMNRFSAAITLCTVSLQELVEMSPIERIEGLGGYIGVQEIEVFNAYLEARMPVVASSTPTFCSEDLYVYDD